MEHWSRSTIAYQIYPLSFKDSNKDGKGDLGGILEKIDYLNGSPDSLGINAVWLSPIYRSPMADFGYDVSDFTAIDPVFGDMQTFEKLVEALHGRGIKLILDFVGNHTSAQHEWFIESRSSKDNPKRNWFVWKDPGPDGGVPNNWMSVFGGSAWEFDPTTKQYYFHNFLKEQPDLNWRNQDVRDAMFDVLEFWIGKGVDGFRIDALQHFVEDKFFRNDPDNTAFYPTIDDPYKTLVHKYSLGGDKEGMKIISEFITKVLEKHQNTFIVGEAYVGTSDLKKIYELCPNGRLAPFNFNLIGLPWSAFEYKKSIDEYQAMLEPNFIGNYVLGNHDLSRVANRLGDAQARLSAFLQMTLPGMPFIYYGEELGMKNGVIPKESIQDALFRIFKGAHPGRDIERTPMQWNDAPHAGFSEARPWLPVGGDYKTANTVQEQKEQDSMLNLYKSLIQLRKKSEALMRGGYEARHSNSANVFSFIREHGSEKFLVVANFGENVEREIISESTHPTVVFSTSKSQHQDLSRGLELLPFEGYVIRL